MNLILCYILGYRVYTFLPEDIPEVVNLFLKGGISAKFLGNKIYVRVGKTREINDILGTRVKFTVSDMYGLGGFLYRLRGRGGMCLALLLSFVIFLFSQDVVWDVRISGSEGGFDEEIKKELSESGLYVGSLWSRTDKSRVEVDVLSKSEYISWLNINRRGNVAYVSVIDKETHENPPEKTGYANVVAKRDAVIEEITVIHGTAEVKAGDSVKKGDILISGVLPAESGGGFCYAEGIVIGRVSDSVEVSVQDFKEVREYEKRKIKEIKLNIFNFSLNIFKSYGNSDITCDIIKENRLFSFFGGPKLPFYITKTYALPYSTVNVSLSSDEMVSLAGEKMAEALSERLDTSTLVRIKTDGGFADGSYIMRSSFVCTEDIGSELPFSAEEN